MITKLNVTEVIGAGFDYIMGVKYNCNEICDYLFDKNNFSEKDTAMENGLKIKDVYIKIKDFLKWKIEKIIKSKSVNNEDEKIICELSKIIDTLKDSDNFNSAEYKETVAKIDLKIKNSLYNLLKKYEGEYETEIRFVMCLNEEMKKLKFQTRDENIKKISKELDTLLKNTKDKENLNIEKKILEIFEGYRAKYFKFFEIEREEKNKKMVGYKHNKNMIASAEKKDGIFILQTNRTDLKKEEIVTSYKNLKEVEEINDGLKNFVDVRPVRHILEKRIRAHVFICMLALLLKRIAELNYFGKKFLTETLEEISKVKYVKYKVKFSEKELRNKILAKISTPTQRQKDIFKKAGIKNYMKFNQI